MARVEGRPTVCGLSAGRRERRQPASPDGVSACRAPRRPGAHACSPHLESCSWQARVSPGRRAPPSPEAPEREVPPVPKVG